MTLKKQFILDIVVKTYSRNTTMELELWWYFFHDRLVILMACHPHHAFGFHVRNLNGTHGTHWNDQCC